MAIVILCGLVSSTALNMLVVPALYLRFGAHGRRMLGSGTRGSGPVAIAEPGGPGWSSTK
jgi:hypothetical protein